VQKTIVDALQKKQKIRVQKREVVLTKTRLYALAVLLCAEALTPIY